MGNLSVPNQHLQESASLGVQLKKRTAQPPPIFCPDVPLMRHRARRRPRHQITHHTRLDVNGFHCSISHLAPREHDAGNQNLTPTFSARIFSSVKGNESLVMAICKSLQFFFCVGLSLSAIADSPARWRSFWAINWRNSSALWTTGPGCGCSVSQRRRFSKNRCVSYPASRASSSLICQSSSSIGSAFIRRFSHQLQRSANSW